MCVVGLLVVVVLFARLFLTLCDLTDCSPPGSSIHGFSRQEYWSGLPFPSPEDLPDPGIEPRSPASQAASLLFELQGKIIQGEESKFWKRVKSMIIQYLYRCFHVSIITVVLWSEIKDNFYFLFPAFQNPSCILFLRFFLLALQGTWGLWMKFCGLAESLYFEFSSEHKQDNVTYTSGLGTAMEGRCSRMGRSGAI